MKDVFDELAAELSRLGGGTAVASPTSGPRLAKITSIAPLTFVLMDGSGAVLRAGDQDVEIADAIYNSGIVREHASAGAVPHTHGAHEREGPQVGDVLVVHEDRHGDWIAVAILKGT